MHKTLRIPGNSSTESINELANGLGSTEIKEQAAHNKDDSQQMQMLAQQSLRQQPLPIIVIKNNDDEDDKQPPQYEPPFLFWAKRSAIMATPYAVSLLLLGFLGPVVGTIAICGVYEHIERDIYMKTQGITNPAEVPAEIYNIFITRRNYMGGPFLIGSVISMTIIFCCLDDLAKTFTAGAMINTYYGAPLEAQMVMMGIVGAVFGMSMMLMKIVEAYTVGKKLSATELSASFVTGVLVGAGLYVASLIPGFNHAYDGGISKIGAILLAVLGETFVLGASFGAYMYVAHHEYQKTEPLPTAKMLRMMRQASTLTKDQVHTAATVVPPVKTEKTHQEASITCRA